ncbi:hypothetical protein RS030_4566 [Cryptosporidium xiaoi]|uniref:Uncharacterized protein n=1 Tax=Cryptosporidium xiaoi TaxID=659607 RepID=A0AAV9XV62_9CRYT
MIKFSNVSLIALLLYVIVFNIDNKLIGYSPTTNFYTHGNIEFSLLRLKCSPLDKIGKCLRGCFCCCKGKCSNGDDDDDYPIPPLNPPTNSIPIPKPRDKHPKTTLQRYRDRLNGETGSGYPSSIWTLQLSLETINEVDEPPHEEENNLGFVNQGFSSEGEDEESGGGGGGIKSG